MRVMVNVGDTIARDQPVLELETDKATIEVPSTVAGVVKEVRVKNGDKVKVGAVVLTVEENGAGAAEKPAAAKAEPKPSAEEAAPAAVPAGELAQPTDSPTTPESRGPAPAQKPDSKILSMPVRSGTEPVQTPAAAPRAEAPAKVEAIAPGKGEGPRERGPVAPASPAVRRLAREIGVVVDEVQGSGPGGRISQDDVKEHARRILSSVPSGGLGAGAPGVVTRASRPLPDFAKWGEVERQPVSNIRRVTAEH